MGSSAPDFDRWNFFTICANNAVLYHCETKMQRIRHVCAGPSKKNWRNTTRVAKAVYTTHRSEVFKTGGGPAPKQPSSAVERVIHLTKDTTSFRGIQGGLETESFHTNQPTNNATLPEEDASQDLYESAASLISDSPPPPSPQSPSLLTGYDPILTQTVVPHVPEQTNKSEKTVRTPLKKVTVQDIHDMQYRALQGKLEIQEKHKIQMDLEKNKLELQIELLQKLVGGNSEPVTLSQALASMY
ncbi:unnamed protein product [Mytilus edulis]|uniref:Uncharacterized protein n=1 Tax=Mytilus edulis TaxID=6550 RepID=A0A8S3PY93_MYTED|nr:unnamed protein product [Mytilus edulis]